MTEMSCDYDTARPSPAAIKAAGYAGVWRYLDGGAVPGKSLTVPEAKALHAAGLGIGLIWETTGDRAWSGEAAGAADGAAAVAQCRALGVPAGAPVLCNVGDVPAAPAQIPAIHAYYYAFRRAPGFDYQGGGYATGYVIDALVAGGAAGLWWQNAENDAGESGSVVSKHADVYQRLAPVLHIAGAAGEYDEDVVVVPGSVHWWTPVAAAPPPAPAPAPAPVPVSVLDGYLVTAGGAGGYTGRAVTSEDSGATWR